MAEEAPRPDLQWNGKSAPACRQAGSSAARRAPLTHTGLSKSRCVVLAHEGPSNRNLFFARRAVPEPMPPPLRSTPGNSRDSSLQNLGIGSRYRISPFREDSSSSYEPEGGSALPGTASSASRNFCDMDFPFGGVIKPALLLKVSVPDNYQPP